MEDAGIPPAWAETARKRIENRVRPSSAGYKAWMLKGYIRCACGSALTPMTSNPNKIKRYYYYACEKERRHGKGSCPYAHYYKAEETEERVAAFVLGLARNPETFREQIEAEAAREKAALRDTRKRVAALAHRLSEADSERDRLVRLYTRGKLTDGEYDAYTAEIDKRKRAVEEELERLEDERRYVEYLDSLPRLVEDYLKELPTLIDEMPRIREYTLSDEHKARLDRDRRNGHGLKPYPVVPGTYRKRTPEEMDELRREAERGRAERYRGAFEMLGLKVVAYPDETLEISWRGGFRTLSGPF